MADLVLTLRRSRWSGHEGGADVPGGVDLAKSVIQVSVVTPRGKELVNKSLTCKPISAVLLYATLGSGEAFSSGREFSAYLGLTPKQYNSGGKANLVGISHFVANKRLRAVLIQGARAYIHRVKDAKTMKDKWLLDLVNRAGYGKASVALANKNVRTAWAMLTQGTEYRAEAA